jgi:hypothetical protein
VIFWIGLSCWSKSYSNKATLLLGVCPRYKYYTVVITIEFTVKKYPSLNWQWIFYFLRRCFLCCITAETFTGLDCLTRWVSYKKQELLTLREHLTSPLVFWLGQCCSSFYFFYVVPLCVFTFWVPCCDVLYDFHIKRCSVRLYHQLFVGEFMCYCVLCVCLRILMSSSSTLPPVVCRRVHVLLCFVCMFTYIDVQQFDFATSCL